MYEVTKNVILSGSYELADILTKIDTLWMQGSLTDAEREELVNLARTKADPSNSFAPLQAQNEHLGQAERPRVADGGVVVHNVISPFSILTTKGRPKCMNTVVKTVRVHCDRRRIG